LNWLKNNPIAHRGLHNNQDKPENSYAAFNFAIENNFPIELDLQITSDKKLIVFHDDSLLRMTGVDKNVISTSYDEIKTYKLLNTNEQIPLFAEFLEHINSRIPLLIEIKNFNLPNSYEETVIHELESYKGEYAIQSFNPLTVRWLKINAPQITRGQIASKFRGSPVPHPYKYFLRNLALNFTAKPHFINYNIDDLPYLPVELYRNYGIPILAWTIKTKIQLEKAKDLCDNFVFENFNPSELSG